MQVLHSVFRYQAIVDFSSVTQKSQTLKLFDADIGIECVHPVC